MWFSADIARARDLFLQRGGIKVANFDTQVLDIQRAGLPNELQCVQVEALTKAGALRDPSEILREIFSK